MLLVDTNVLLDVVQDDPKWGSWSQAQLDAAAAQGALMINAIIYAELSLAFERIEQLESLIARAKLQVEPIPREALFLAGKAFLLYRRRSGTKTGVLPDFFIGAHAAVTEVPLLTRDASRYKSYFPTVELISP